MFQSTQDEAALIDATRAFVKTVSSLGDFHVSVEKVAPEAARLKVSDPAGRVAPAWVFAKKRDGKWKVLDLGTGFDPAYYERHGIPAAVRL
jgi:hypothetical protein